jgi:hypothetical protein
MPGSRPGSALDRYAILGGALTGVLLGAALWYPVRAFVIGYRRFAHEKLSQNKFFRWFTNFFGGQVSTVRFRGDVAMNPIHWVRWKVVAVLAVRGGLVYFLGLDKVALSRINAEGPREPRRTMVDHRLRARNPRG